MKFPFSTYDFFGYLACGFLLVCAAEFAFDGKWLLFANPTPAIPLLAFWFGIAYVTGHLVASISSFLIEHTLVRRLLRSPEETLFNPVTGCRSYLFPVYYHPFPQATRDRVLERSTRAGFTKADRALFFHCHTKVKGLPTTSERLATFLNIYGFCRNMCMACLLAIPILGTGILHDMTNGWVELPYRSNWLPSDTTKAMWAAVALVAAIGMLYRYLKFFKHYTQEVYTTYAEL